MSVNADTRNRLLLRSHRAAGAGYVHVIPHFTAALDMAYE